MQSLAGTTETTPIWPLFQTVCSSITQVILVTISGYYLSRRGLLDKTTQKLHFLCPRINYESFGSYRSFSRLSVAVSLVVAWLLGSLFRLDRTHRNFAMAAAMIMNSNSLPVRPSSIARSHSSGAPMGSR
ncbi:hypothetical protein EDB85DRAFT_1341764 [Lactarius pseudohatsudake]|nr:hypothetical protein EDB85DRAFT_1341764 [Lactarius pseudohatsudake]